MLGSHFLDDGVVRGRGEFGVAPPAHEVGEQHLAGGRAALEHRAGEERAEDGAAFHARGEEAETAEGMGHVLAAVGGRDHRHRRIQDLLQRPGGLGSEGIGEPRGLSRGNGQHHRAGVARDGFAVQVVDHDEGAVGQPRQRDDPRAERHPPDAAGQGVGEGPHAAPEREALGGVLGLLRAPLAFARAENGADDEAAVTLLERVQLRKRRGYREPVRVAGVDAGHEGLDGVVEEFAAEPAAHEMRDRLLLVRGLAADEGLEGEARLGERREERGGEEGARRHRQRDGPAVSDDEARVGDLARRQALGRDARRLDELADERGGVERAVGAGLVQRAVAVHGADHAAGLGGRF